MKTTARFTGEWTVEVTVEPGSVPDRPVSYSRNGSVYRPARMVAEFTTRAVHEDPHALQMENGSGFMRAARDGLHLSALVIRGPRVKKDGTPGQQDYEEKFWASAPHIQGLPDWAAEAVKTALGSLGGQ
jgi:hypothetical protein